MLSKEQVLKIAQLARIRLNDEEVDTYAHQLSAVLDFFEQMKEVDASKGTFDYQVEGLKGVTRSDQIVPVSEEMRRKLIDAFPEREGDLLKVPGVFKEES